MSLGVWWVLEVSLCLGVVSLSIIPSMIQGVWRLVLGLDKFVMVYENQSAHVTRAGM